MIAVLRLDRDGVVIDANHAANALLGACVGRRCCDVVLARRGREMHCSTTCVAKLLSGTRRSSEEPGVTIRGKNCSLTCAQLAGSGVVMIHEGGEAIGPAVTLSPREAEAITAVAHGLETKAVAERLGISPATARTHIGRARAKLGATTRAHAVAIALKRRLISF